MRAPLAVVLALAPAVVLAPGCRGGGGAGSTGPAPRSGPTCASVMPRLTEASVAALEDGGAGPDITGPAREDAERLEPHLIQLCLDDGWSAEALACIESAPLVEMGDTCEPLFTPAQIDAIIRLRETHAPAM